MSKRTPPVELSATTLAATLAARNRIHAAAEAADVPIYAILHGVIEEATNNAALMKRATTTAKSVYGTRKKFYRPQGAAAHKHAATKRGRSK